MPPSRPNSITIVNLPPEILIPIFARVAVDSPSTFFSLGLVCFEFKALLTFYRPLIVRDIKELIDADVCTYICTCNLIFNPNRELVLPLRFCRKMPLYAHFINEKLPIFSRDPTTFRRIQFFLEWVIDIVVLPGWLPYSVTLPSPIMTKMMEMVQRDYDFDGYVSDSDSEDDLDCVEKFLMPTLLLCEPGDPDNVIVYEAIESSGLSFEYLGLSTFPLLFQHLAAIRLQYGDEMYRVHLERIVSNEYFIHPYAITVMEKWYKMEVEVLKTGLDGERVIYMKRDWYILESGSINKLAVGCRINADSVLFWQAFYDHLVLAAPGSEMGDEFFVDLLSRVLEWRLDNRLLEYCLQNYPGGVNCKVIEQVLRHSLPSNRILFHLVERYDHSIIVDVILSIATAENQNSLFKEIGDVLVKFPFFEQVFYEKVISDGPFMLGVAVWDFEKYDVDFPYVYILAAAERSATDIVEMFIQNNDVDDNEDMLTDFIHRNESASFISWCLETMNSVMWVRPEFIDDLVDIATALEQEDTVDELLRFNDDPLEYSSSFIGKKEGNAKGNRLITDYFKPI